MTDLAERILAAITADENAASNEARGWETGSRYEGQPINWVHHVQRWPVDRVRIRCTADREIVEDCREQIFDALGSVETMRFAERVLARLARGYGVQP